MEQCQFEKTNNTNLNGLYCPGTFDSLLCWPSTPAGQIASQPCPRIQGIDNTKTATRKCSITGQWESGPSPGSDPGNLLNGWTNYSDCYLPHTKDLLEILENDPENEVQMKLKIAYFTRILEFVGLSISLASLLGSLLIFHIFRNLRNPRTRIHGNLFISIGIQVTIRLILYVDQEIPKILNGIHKTPILCEFFYAILEYCRTAMFAWMFIEGFYLHNLVIVMVFQPNAFKKIHVLFGWGSPLILTTIWASYNAVQQPNSICWWGYSLISSYWILEGPRLALIFVNLGFLLNILRLLVTKLRSSRRSEAEQLRKAVKAAIVLLPLLGITNVLSMVMTPVNRSVWEFASWSFVSHFLTSFQGFFVSFIYCFLNNEVRTAVCRRFELYVVDNRFRARFMSSYLQNSYQLTNDLQQKVTQSRV